MKPNSSRSSRSLAGRARAGAAVLVIAAFGIGLSACGTDDVGNANDAINDAQDKIDDVQGQIDKVQTNAPAEVQDKIDAAQKKLDDELNN
ncbi:MAG: hypothetical protein EXQ70_10230 [Solirubrobacterales bacterium]|nr:hypothetical protein [Solirubrobacterales bacterium]